MSGMIDFDSNTNELPFGFEGCEKRLEVDFLLPCDLRLITRDVIDKMLGEAKCTIIGSRSNKFLDSYVLSESSLFIYPNKLIIKTCGTTTLLNLLPTLLEVAKELGTVPTFVQFSRSDFLFPSKQPSPHQNFNMEADYLNSFFQGSPYILGPLNSPWWHLYTAHCGRVGAQSPMSCQGSPSQPNSKRQRLNRVEGTSSDESDEEFQKNSALQIPSYTFEMVMFNLSRERMQQFYRRGNDPAWTGEEITRSSGIGDLIPGSSIDNHLFDPCGYSCNGLKDDTYFTIHVTPEPHCSFVSFETNLRLENYSELVLKVLDVFKPGKFSVSLLVEGGRPLDSLALCEWNYESSGYSTTGTTYHTLEGNTNVTVGQFQPASTVSA